MSQRPVVNPDPIPHIRTVPTGNALEWIRIGVMLFRAYPLMWGVLFMMYFAIMQLLSLLGAVGSLFGALIAPVFAGGLMLGSQAIERKQALEINHLFAGFKAQKAQLVKLGFYYISALFVFSMIIALMLDPSTLEALPKGQQLTPEQLKDLSQPLLLLGLLITPVLMAFWFAPALVAIDQLHPWQALLLSFKACIKNVLPLLFYSFLMGLFFVVILTLSQLLGPMMQNALLLVVIFLLLPVMMTSLYISYRDIFISANDS